MGLQLLRNLTKVYDVAYIYGVLFIHCISTHSCTRNSMQVKQ